MSQGPAKPSSKAEREQRRAAALRENLKRRKQQARQKAQASPPDKPAKGGPAG